MFGGSAALAAFHEVYDAQAARSPKVPAVVCRGPLRRQVLTYEALCERSAVLAAGLAQLAVRETAPRDINLVVAVHLPRTNLDFVPLLVAVSRVGLTFCLLSTDLPEKALEEERNALIYKLLQPWLRVTSDTTGTNGCVAVSVDVLAASGAEALRLEADTGSVRRGTPPSPSSVLCLLFTGGTRRTKVVKVTHAMFLHERTVYREVWAPRSTRPIVLAHTSVFWGASALGQLSIALAYGGTAVLSEATEVPDMQRCIAEEGVTVLGVVPNHLDVLAPESPDVEFPEVECVFTWGERLPRRVAERWRGHRRAALRELLISTEYWCSLYADPLDDGTLRITSGVDILVRTADGRDAGTAEVGELCLAGPMVTCGYHEAGALPEGDQFLNFGGRRYFCTNDLVRRIPGGLAYKGRADMMAKDKGKWVDMVSVEDALLGLSEVVEAKITSDPHNEHFHAFVVLDTKSHAGPALRRMRELLPAQVQLWVIPELPRHVVTRKVDERRLLQCARAPAPSWPYEGALNPTPQLEQDIHRERLYGALHNQCTWTIAALGIILVASDASHLVFQLGLALAWLCTLYAASLRHPDDSGILMKITLVWFVSAVSVDPNVSKYLRWVLLCAAFPYAWLAVTYIEGQWHRKDQERFLPRAAKLITTFVDNMPFRTSGVSLILYTMSCRLPYPVALVPMCILLGLTAAGFFAALWRGRLLAWPLVFWSLGFANRMDREGTPWLWKHTWRQLYVSFVDLLRAFWSMSRVHHSAGAVGLWAEPANTASGNGGECTSCKSLCSRWPALDPSACILCDACGESSVIVEAATATAWLEGVVRADPTAAAAVASPSIVPSGTRRGVAEEPAKKRLKTAPSGQLVGPVAKEVSSEAARAAWRGGKEERALFGRFDRWWWHNKTEHYFDFSDAERERAEAALGEVASIFAAVDENEGPSPSEYSALDAQLLCTIVSEIAPQLRPVRPGTLLVGLDSLSVTRMAYYIKAQMGRSLSIASLREMRNVAALAVAIGMLEDARCRMQQEAAAVAEPEREYAVWFSPGQYTPMGNWVLRSDEAIDRLAMERALQQLIDRHGALRADICDPLHYMSFLYDAAVLWSLYCPLLDSYGSRFLNAGRRLVSWALTKAWWRISSRSREQVYGEHCPSAVPYKVISTDRQGKLISGQTSFERELKTSWKGLVPPFGATVLELTCHLQDVWHYKMGGAFRGRFAILERPSGLLPGASGADLIYVDTKSGEWGPLISPLNERWQRPPYRFAALYFVPLSSGTVVWIRLESADEVRVCYAEGPGRGERVHHAKCFRAAPQRGREKGGPPTVVRFLSLSVFHAFSDGNCYMPLVQDLFTLYEAERRGELAVLPPLQSHAAFEALQRRLMDTLECRPSPQRASLRGGCFKFAVGGSYGFHFAFEPGAVAVLQACAACYRVPFDVILLGLVVCASSRADRSERFEATMYSPQRDGASEAMMIGLFSDWRDVSVNIDFELATVLGTLLHINHTIQQRHWVPFNALRKPEATIVNIQPLDLVRRSHFHHLGENLWTGGDRLKDPPTRPEGPMERGRQPLTINIEQQDETTWWILMDLASKHRPPSWLRTFLACLTEAMDNLIYDPLARVHRPLPDAELLEFARWRQMHHMDAPTAAAA